MRLTALITALTLVTLPAAVPSEAIVIRHDTPDAEYRADEADFPALASLYRTKAGHRDCVATLVSPRWLLTAAHCTEGEEFVREVEAGTRRVELAGDREATVDRLVRHPGGDEFVHTPDIALLRLTEPVDDVAPMELYDHADEEGRVVVTLGWGGSGDGLEGLRKPEDGLFRVAENRVEAARDHFLILRWDDPRSGTHPPLALEGISGPGDSGAPALLATPHGWRVVGISAAQRSFGRPEGLYGAEEYFVRVTDFRDWIAGVMAD